MSNIFIALNITLVILLLFAWNERWTHSPQFTSGSIKYYYLEDHWTNNTWELRYGNYGIWKTFLWNANKITTCRGRNSILVTSLGVNGRMDNCFLFFIILQCKWTIIKTIEVIIIILTVDEYRLLKIVTYPRSDGSKYDLLFQILKLWLLRRQQEKREKKQKIMLGK